MEVDSEGTEILIDATVAATCLRRFKPKDDSMEKAIPVLVSTVREYLCVQDSIVQQIFETFINTLSLENAAMVAGVSIEYAEKVVEEVRHNLVDLLGEDFPKAAKVYKQFIKLNQDGFYNNNLFPASGNLSE